MQSCEGDKAVLQYIVLTALLDATFFIHPSLFVSCIHDNYILPESKFEVTGAGFPCRVDLWQIDHEMCAHFLIFSPTMNKRKILPYIGRLGPSW